jgi:hypothetical protein
LLDVTNLFGVSAGNRRVEAAGYLAGSGGHSVNQGHTLIVFTLEPLFFTTVIFISFSQSV